MAYLPSYGLRIRINRNERYIGEGSKSVCEVAGDERGKHDGPETTR
jgi:hypothetical protein